MSNNDTLESLKTFEKLTVLINNNIISERALVEIKRTQATLLDTKNQNLFYWNASLIAYINKDYNYANYTLRNYHLNTRDSSFEYVLLQTLIAAKTDTAQAKSSLAKLNQQSDSLDCLACIVDIERYELKNKKLLVNSSRVIPGLGSMLNGNILKGFTSLAITGGTVALSYYLIQNKCYFNSFGWGLTLGAKFYSGNVRLTEKLVNDKEHRKKNELTKTCELAWKKVFLKYPLQLK